MVGVSPTQAAARRALVSFTLSAGFVSLPSRPPPPRTPPQEEAPAFLVSFVDAPALKRSKKQERGWVLLSLHHS